MGDSRISEPQDSRFQSVIIEGPSNRNCLEFRGLKETSIPPFPTLAVLISCPLCSVQSLKDRYHVVIVILQQGVILYHRVILKSGTPERVSRDFPFLEKDKAAYSSFAPPTRPN